MYKELLEYLETEKGKSTKRGSTTVPIKPPPSPTPNTPKELSVPPTIKEFKNLEAVSETNKINAYNPSSDSKGFDVNKFEGLMVEHLHERTRSIGNYERPNISVTELFNCLRRTFYTRLKYEVDQSKIFTYPYLYLMGPVGNTVHDLIQQLYPFIETEKTLISERYRVKGRTDGLTKHCVVEIKTIDEKKFKNNYRIEDFYQGNLYGRILNTDYGGEIDTVTLVYVLRSLNKIFPFDIPLDNELADNFLKGADILHAALTSKIAPDVINANAEQCKWCHYKEYCINDPSDSPKPFENKVAKEGKRSAFLL